MSAARRVSVASSRWCGRCRSETAEGACEGRIAHARPRESTALATTRCSIFPSAAARSLRRLPKSRTASATALKRPTPRGKSSGASWFDE